MNKEDYKAGEEFELVRTLSYEPHEFQVTIVEPKDDEEQKGSPQPEEPPPTVSCITWNSTGGSIAVGYCQRSHEKICSHKSAVAVWSMFMKAFSGTKPSLVLDSPACITAVQFHPKDQKLLIGGTFNGNVIMWDVQAEEPFICMSEIDDYFHREAVTQLLWVPVLSDFDLSSNYVPHIAPHPG